VNADTESRSEMRWAWPVAAIVLGTLAATNPFYAPHITLRAGIAAWCADMLLVLILSAHPATARVGVLVAGLFLAVPCFLWESPLARGFLMCFMGLPLAVAAFPFLVLPNAGFRARRAYVLTWLGIKRRARSFDVGSLLHLIGATVIFAAAMATVKAVPAAGPWLFVRWLAGGIMVLAFGEMATALHQFLTTLMGITAPSLMQSPHRSVSLQEFWTRRWNPSMSELVFRPFFFAPLARRGVVLAVFAAFLASALAHVLLMDMAGGKWGIAFMCGAFFLVQPLFIIAERRMKVRRWRPTAGRTWTFAVLAITSPLFVEPNLQLVALSWGAPDNVLLPTLVVLGAAIVVSVLFALPALAFCRAHVAIT
jgi:hypothetical protein